MHAWIGQAVRRRAWAFLRESAFYFRSSTTMYGNTASINGIRRPLYDGVSVAKGWPGSFSGTSRIRFTRLSREFVRTPRGEGSRNTGRSPEGRRSVMRAGVHLLARIALSAVRAGWHVTGETFLETSGNSGKRVTLYRDSRCGRWHKT